MWIFRNIGNRRVFFINEMLLIYLFYVSEHIQGFRLGALDLLVKKDTVMN
jgi:hypothetical protein